MADFTIKRGDRRPILEATLTDEDGPIDLTSAASVKLLLKSGATTVDGACVVVSAVAGTVSYTWGATDTLIVGAYDAEFEITWSTGIVETVPNDSYFSVEFVQDLG
jgi:hypothetical protein